MERTIIRQCVALASRNMPTVSASSSAKNSPSCGRSTSSDEYDRTATRAPAARNSHLK